MNYFRFSCDTNILISSTFYYRFKTFREIFREGRVYDFTVFMMRYGVVYWSINHHYLGCGDPRELLIMKELGLAYGNDSSTAIWHGALGIRFDDTASGLINGKSKIN